MATEESVRTATIEHVRRSFGDIYPSLRFPTVDEANAASRERDDLLKRLHNTAKLCCNHSKIHSGKLTTGCSLCVEGSWSCLFINGVCQADCFFCPKPNLQQKQPTADGLSFSGVNQYVDYVSVLDSRGVGISGGEPLLDLDTSLEYIGALRQNLGDDLHVWLYSNGMKANVTNLGKLRDAGLNEIRFNIAADGYRLDALQKAIRLFDTVVVEIPVVPEDLGRLTQCLVALSDLDVDCLNLHQLWCSTHNAARLSQRPYHFLHGSRVSVLESEIAALKIMEHAANTGIDLPIHYCSAVYKQRFQAAAGLRRDARLVAECYEDVTNAGLIRQLSITGSTPDLRKQIQTFDQGGANSSDYRFTQNAERLLFKARLWPLVDHAKHTPQLRYDIAYRANDDEPQESETIIPIGPDRSLRVRRSPVSIQRFLPPSDLSEFQSRVVNGENERSALCPREQTLPHSFGQFEEIEAGWPDYF